MSSKEQVRDFWSLVEELINSSELKYRSGEYKQSIEDRRRAKSIVIERCNYSKGKSKFRSLIKGSKVVHSKYDLINDYKRKIDDVKKSEIISKLEKSSELKYNSGDYRGAIKVLRRAEKYY